MFCSEFHLCHTALCLLEAAPCCFSAVSPPWGCSLFCQGSCPSPTLGHAPHTFFLSPVLPRESPSLADPVDPGMRWYLLTALTWQMVSKSHFFLFSHQPCPGAEMHYSSAQPLSALVWRTHNTVQSQGSYGMSWNWSSQSGTKVVLAIGHCYSLHKPNF